MPAVVIRKLDDETHDALKERASRHGRSTEAEIRAILQDVVRNDVARRWQDEYADAIKAYNAMVDEGRILSAQIPGWWNNNGSS
jgi:plasmid stability protein